MGEDVHRLNGGTNGATKGLKAGYPDRILGTPISENAFTGLGGGIAMDGRFKPVVEFMYADFMWVAADQLFNQIGKARHMFGGDDPVPVRVAEQGRHGHRLRIAALHGPGRGLRHQPRLADRRPLHAVRLRGPDEQRTALPGSGRRSRTCRSLQFGRDGPVDDLDYCLEVGKAAIRRVGSQITIISYLAMTNYVLKAVEELGGAGDTAVDAEVIDLRWLDRASIDWDTIGDSIKQNQQCADRRAGCRSAPATAAGWPTRSNGGTSTGWTSPSSGSPAVSRRRASARSWSAPRSPRTPKSPPRSPRS